MDKDILKFFIFNQNVSLLRHHYLEHLFQHLYQATFHKKFFGIFLLDDKIVIKGETQDLDF